MEKGRNRSELGEQAHPNGETRRQSEAGTEKGLQYKQISGQLVCLNTGSDHQNLSFLHIKCYFCFPQ